MTSFQEAKRAKMSGGQSPWKNSSRTGHITIVLVAVLFALGFSFLWGTGIGDYRHLADDIVASYFLVWGLYALLSHTSRNEIRKQFALTTLTLTLCIGLLELPGAIGLVNYREIFSDRGFPNWWNVPGFVEDDELLWIHPPHYHRKGHYFRGNIGEVLCTDGYLREYDVQYDSNGFRNDTDMTSADIAVLGDSFVESSPTPSNALMTTALGRLENSLVANLGISGYGPLQELIVMKRYALPLHPKTIVWVFYEGNDLEDINRYYEDRRHLSVPKANALPVLLWQNSFTKNMLSTIIRVGKGCQPDSSVAEYYAEFKDKDGDKARVYFLADYYNVPQRKADALSTIRSTLTEANQLARLNGVRLVVVFAPTEFRVYSGLSNVIRVSDSAKQWVVNDLPDRLHSIVAAISPHIDYLDLTPAFKIETEKGSRLFLSDDPHWTNEGHRIAAQALHKVLIGRGPLYVEHSSEKRPQHNAAPDLVHEAMMVRDTDGTIRYWNKSAQDLYGWTAQEALGKLSHVLLKTHFPIPLSAIEKEIGDKNYWQGELIHRRRDGSQVSVISRWELQESPAGQSMTVVEVNREHRS